MHQLSDIQLDVLSRIADDVEAPHTIAGDMARDLGRPVSDAEVLIVLLELVGLGAASAFEYNHSTQRYELLDGARASSAADPWFRAKRDFVVQQAPPRA